MGARRNCPIRRNECIALCMEGEAINANRLQPQRQQTESADSAQCLLPHSCFAGGDVDSGCMRLQVTQSSARQALPQPKY